MDGDVLIARVDLDSTKVEKSDFGETIVLTLAPDKQIYLMKGRITGEAEFA